MQKFKITAKKWVGEQLFEKREDDFHYTLWTKNWAKIALYHNLYEISAFFCFIIIIMYLYSAQYLHILQDSKCYLTNLTVQVQPQLTSN